MTNYSQERRKILKQNPHLKAYLRKRLLFFFVKLFLLEMGVIALSFYLSGYTARAPMIGLFLGGVLPWVTVKPQRFFGKIGICEITKVLLLMKRVPRHKGFTRYYTDFHNRPFIVCHVKGTYRRKFKLEYEKCYEGAFQTGDRLLMLVGCNYPINLTAHDWIVCPFCGNVMPRASENCIGCEANAVLALP